MFYWLDPPTNPPHVGIFSRWTCVPGMLFGVLLCCIAFLKIWFSEGNREVPFWRKLWTSSWLTVLMVFLVGQQMYMFGTEATVSKIEDLLPFLQHWEWHPGGYYFDMWFEGEWVRVIAWRPPERDPFSWRQIWIGTVPVLIMICLMWLTWPREPAGGVPHDLAAEAWEKLPNYIGEGI
jgi:hypothetical protein